MDSIKKESIALERQIQSQSLTAIVGGFSFASAIAWMDAVRWLISQVVHVQRNGGQYYFLTALFTTLLAVLAFTLVNHFSSTKIKDEKPIYAVGI
tara:strand:- start:766 stop:1050 length:285 start_codon:yes stop_codon:yes gene_type:complete